MDWKKVYIFGFLSGLLFLCIAVRGTDEDLLENFRRGVFAQEKGDYKLALTYFVSIKDIEPYVSPFVNLRIAQCKDALGETSEGVQILEELVSKGEENQAWRLPVVFHLAKLYEKQGRCTIASDYYRQIYSVSFVPWWLVSYLTDVGIFFINTDKFQQEGSVCLQKVINYGGYNLYRKNALLSLCLSSRDEDKVYAIRYLLKGGYLSEAWFLLYNKVSFEFLTYVGPSNAIDKWRIFEDMGKGFISQVNQNKQIEYISLLYEYALRCAVLSGKYRLANSMFDLMNYDFPINFDVGEYLYWAGQKAEKSKNEEYIILYYQLLMEHFPQHKRVSDALFLSGFWFYNKGEFDNAQRYFEKIEKEYPQSSYYSRTLYLLASIAEKKGEKTKAKEYYQKALHGNIGDYYVHLSADKIVKEIHISGLNVKVVPFKHIPVSKLPRKELLSNDVNRIMERVEKDTELKWLFHFSQLGTDEKEWIAYFICEQFRQGKKEENVLALLSHAGLSQVVWDYIYSSTSGGFADIQEHNKNQILFPLPYYKSVVYWTKKMNIDPYLVWAIMKQESSYRTSVVSVSDAKGLLQVLPSTAEWIVKKDNRIKGIDPLLWKYPEYNIAVGTAYFRYLLDRFQGNIVYAIAGYNAGPGRVDQWKNKNKNNLEAFIEDIPFTETRNYVKKVLGNYAAYHSIYKEF